MQVIWLYVFMTLFVNISLFSQDKSIDSLEKNYSNLAWLLQSTEVKVMFKVWYNLIENKIPFLSVHDEIIIRESDFIKANDIFRAVLTYEFEFFKLNGKTVEVKAQKNIVPETIKNTKPQSSTDWIFEPSIKKTNWDNEIKELEQFIVWIKQTNL